MALAPAFGLMLLSDISAIALFAVSGLASFLALFAAHEDRMPEKEPELPLPAVHLSFRNRIYEAGTGHPVGADDPFWCSLRQRQYVHRDDGR